MGDQTRVLIVDDEESNCNILRKQLELKGYNTEYARDGAQAFVKIYEYNPQIIILDVFMVGLKGDEIITSLKAFRPNIPIIMNTGNPSPEIREKCLRLGAFEFILKPVNLDNLDQTIQKALREASDSPESIKLSVNQLREVELVFNYLNKIGLLSKEQTSKEIEDIRKKTETANSS